MKAPVLEDSVTSQANQINMQNTLGFKEKYENVCIFSITLLSEETVEFPAKSTDVWNELNKNQIDLDLIISTARTSIIFQTQYKQHIYRKT